MNETPNITLHNGQPVTTSLDVAERFGKRHRDVLRAITNLECSKAFTERNFALSSYLDPTGRALPMHHITRDGFAFLAMGFTGKEAARWKESYITAFNTLAEELQKARQEVANRHLLLLNDMLSGLFKRHPNWPVIRSMVAASQPMAAILQAIHRKSPATVYRAASMMADHGLMEKTPREGSRKKRWNVPQRSILLSD